jgi:hypothetical protein
VPISKRLHPRLPGIDADPGRLQLGTGALALTASTGLTGNLWPATVAVAYGVGVAVARLAKPSGGWNHGATAADCPTCREVAPECHGDGLSPPRASGAMRRVTRLCRTAQQQRPQPGSRLVAGHP